MHVHVGTNQTASHTKPHTHIPQSQFLALTEQSPRQIYLNAMYMGNMHYIIRTCMHVHVGTNQTELLDNQLL